MTTATEGIPMRTNVNNAELPGITSEGVPAMGGEISRCDVYRGELLLGTVVNTRRRFFDFDRYGWMPLGARGNTVLTTKTEAIQKVLKRSIG